ncbi:MAG: hemolysin family protein [Candidatus Poribacteria bacterium]|nr:hemolysin family protein [Candidatus Poribacteria bacterium]MDE0502902.1 hemolysin family protein [Candidatus Poribacteria bacterium]
MPQLLGLGLLLLLSGYFSGSETALCALTRVQVERLRTEKRRNSVAIVNFVDNPRRLFITLLLGNTLVNVAFATIAYWLIRDLPVFVHLERLNNDTLQHGVEFVVGTLLIVSPLLIFGEIVPKTHAIRHPEFFARITARSLWSFSIVISPLRAFLRIIVNFLMPLFGASHTAKAERLTTSDFKTILDTDEVKGLQADERAILGNVLELWTIEAKEIMVPRTDMVALEISARIQEALTRAKEFGYSRIPIYRNQIDDVCGIFQVKDIPSWRHVDIRNMTLETFLNGRHHIGTSDLENTLVRQPVFVLETKKLADLLLELTRQKTNMAILLDEYGGVSGITTIEDILEQLVGDIVDEHDTALKSPNIISSPDNPSLIEVSGRVSVKSINQQLHLTLDEDIADTIGGYVLALLGRVPTVGESEQDRNGIRFEIAAMEGNFVGVVIMTLPQQTNSHLDTT